MIVFSNLATSLDGKIATAARTHFPLGTPEDRDEMQRLRARADVILMGASSLRAFRRPLRVRPVAGLARVPDPPPANAILSSALAGLSPRWPFFTDPGGRRLLFTGPRAPRARVRAFERSCEVIPLRPATARSSTARQVLRALADRGFDRVLVEGGGAVMWDFVRDDLIDEYHVTITPRLLGGTEAPTLVDGVGFAPARVVNLELVECRVVGDELYLVYRTKRRRGV